MGYHDDFSDIDPVTSASLNRLVKIGGGDVAATIAAWHRTGGMEKHGAPSLFNFVLQRHGSVGVELLRRSLDSG